ncbi:MAG: S1 RNA-binding domain-containing protein [Desulfitobacteriaceae bacterium]|nr:S1 RNA-binding domain-containing protein [Desulfitobacteriaceae bacterium]MDD4752082.1 S1 RNA-binding domain-containing protein [Desulfitobacteriaceae bacterium]
MVLAVGSIVEGVVTGITKFGAFVELPGGVTGLVHISEVADAYVKDVKDYLKESDRIKVKVVNIDEKGKIGLSIKQAQPKPAAQPRNAKNEFSFEDKLARYMKDSNEKLTALKRHREGKKGGR